MLLNCKVQNIKSQASIGIGIRGRGRTPLVTEDSKKPCIDLVYLHKFAFLKKIINWGGDVEKNL